MKFSNKVKLSFLILIILFGLTGAYNLISLGANNKNLVYLTNDLNPRISHLMKLRNLIKDTKTYTTNWVYVGMYEQDKEKLETIQKESFPQNQMIIDSLQKTDPIDGLSEIMSNYAQIIEDSKTITSTLTNFDSYQDPVAKFICEDLIENTVIPKADAAVKELDEIIKRLSSDSEQLKISMVSSFDTLKQAMLFLSILITVLSILLAYILTRFIMNVLGGEPQEVLNIAKKITSGDLRDTFDSSKKAIGLYGALYEKYPFLLGVSA